MEALFPRQAESLVTGLLNKLSELAVQELGLLLGVRDEIRYITEELEMMQAFLRHAEEEESSNPVAGAWVNQVREVVFLAEDCIDEFTLHLSKPDSQNWLAGLRGRVGSLTSVKARHRIAAQIQEIKSRVEEVSERRLRYGLTGTSQGSTSTTRLAQYDPRQAALFVDDLQLVGIDGPRETIVRCLLEEGEPAGLHAISIVGMGGLGKTTLARKVYQDRRVSTGGSFPSRAWIVVSQPFNNSVFLRNMLDNLSPTGTDGQSDEQLIQKIQGLLREKRYVIVFDDVWTVDAWESIRLVLPTPCNRRSRIIVTTRNETVAYTCCTQNHRYVYKLKPLSPQLSFDLFCRRVFGPDHPCPEELNKLSVDILTRCAGLPLAIVTIGGLLASKPNKTEQEWKKIINHLGSELESNPSLEGMKHVLTLSYNDLPYPVKRCFLYLSIFPEDHEIRRKHLQTLWIAEGLIVKGHRGADSEEEVAESYFNELIARSMILPSSFSAADGRVKSFRVHDVMLELIVSKSAEHNFVSVLGEHHSPAPGIIRHLSVHGGGGFGSTDYSLESMDLSHVRTYSTFGVADPVYLVSSCRRLRLLTVLDLQGCHYLSKFREMSKLRHLVYLSRAVLPNEARTCMAVQN